MSDLEDKPQMAAKGAPWSIFAAGALLFAATAAMKWWHTIDAPEPGYVKFFRLSVAVCAVLMGIAAFRPRWRPRAVLISTAVCLLSPILILETVVTRDPKTIETVMRQSDQIHAVLYTLRQDEQLSYIPWTDPSEKSIPDTFTNSYNILDGLENSSYYADMGWYLSWIDGGLLLILIGASYGREARTAVKRRRVEIAVAAAAGFLFFHAHLFAGYVYWNLGRAQEADGNYSAALDDYRRAALWDPRWDSDILYHVELGRIYGQLGQTSQPDYWAMVADSYMTCRHYSAAYAVYRDHIVDPDQNGAMLFRYEQALLHMAVVDYDGDRYGLAADLCRRATMLDPTDLQAFYYLGICRNKLGDYRDGIRTWKSIVRMNESTGMFRVKVFCCGDYRKPLTSRAWVYMGWCYYGLQDFHSAMNCRYNSQQMSASEFIPVDAVSM